MSKYQDDQWPVQVFRYSHEKGWELFQQASTCKEKITAAPRRNCVEIRQLRLRVHILRPPERPNGQQEERRKSSHAASVIRRRDTILLSKGDFGAVVLKFGSIADCVAFTDRLTELNREEAYVMNQDKNLQRSRLDMDSILDKYRSSQGHKDKDVEDIGAIQSHLITLLHDKDFISFVDRVEDCLRKNEDCVKMLQAHEYH
jgi:hypothetical protein